MRGDLTAQFSLAGSMPCGLIVELANAHIAIAWPILHGSQVLRRPALIEVARDGVRVQRRGPGVLGWQAGA